MSILSGEILKAAHRGGLISPREFLHLGTRAAVDQTFYRLTREDKLSRVCRGGYMAPVSTGLKASSLLRPWGVIELPRAQWTDDMTASPKPEAAIAAIAERDGVVITPDGAAAARELGLIPELPKLRGRGNHNYYVRILMTSGRAYSGLGTVMRPIRIKAGPKWQFVLGDSRAGTVVRALAWLGKSQVESALEKLRASLAPADRQALLGARARVPCWMARAISISLAQTGSDSVKAVSDS